MSSVSQTIASLLAASVMLLSGTLNEAAPQNDDDGLLFLANRQWRLSEHFQPELRDTRVPGQVRQLREDASLALEEMYAACHKEIGKTLISVSGFRGYDKQKRLYARKLKNVGNNEAKADEYVARPGASEHQLGMAMDVGQQNTTNLSQSFGNTAGGKWVAENCWRFGFIIRYGEEWEAVTGYKFEPWHVRYVGKEFAELLHKNPVPLETFLIDYREKKLLALLTKED